MSSPAELSVSNPRLHEVLSATPEKVRQTMRYRALKETYYLATTVLGYDKLTPLTHGPLCVFLDTCKTRRRLIQMPRSHFKTTIVTVVHRIKDVLNDSTLRILLVGDTAGNAENHLLKIKNHFDGNAMLRWLFPERVWEDTNQAIEWSKKKMYIPTKAAHGEPTFVTVGARGAVVSQHFDIIDADDLIGEDEYYSETEMGRTIEWFSGLEALFVPPVDMGLLDIPSTYWRTTDVYAYAEKFYGRGQEPIPTGPYSYLRGDMAVFRRGARDDNGNPIFPEAVTREYLDRLQSENPERYAAQYANNPYAAGVAYFEKAFLKYYDWKRPDQIIRWVEDDPEKGPQEKFINIDELYIVSLCDPHAGGSARQNRFNGTRASVITTGISVRLNRIFILDCFIKQCPTGSLIDEIFRQNDKWNPQVFSIEANGLQKMLKYWIDERVERDRRTAIPYVPYIPEGDKNGERRIKGLQPLFRAGQIIGQRGFTALWEEYSSWPRGLKDGLDCLAQGLKYWNVGFETVEQEQEDVYEKFMRQARSTVTGY